MFLAGGGGEEENSWGNDLESAGFFYSKLIGMESHWAWEESQVLFKKKVFFLSLLHGSIFLYIHFRSTLVVS